MKLNVILGSTVLSATLNDSHAARDFAAMMPLDLHLSDYHGVEKVSDLPRRLATTGAPGRYDPRRGDITLYAPWGNLALFYEDAPAAAGLVPLGRFDGPVMALRNANTVRFEVAAD
ncbi:cyclophilin-like fold protein [Falsirhodobacter halotolerans]|uniref:cyclophilin-like fold protein n=1 Tax=Falsirhodobacter halotolerans TaxID=1146892 RepID=UPI001FD329A7|nr:cyclophilin-like fold protein [Falsirhodobacter halotolerans]MCJ8139162.1 cyclophilin-like fold protein [Falsirhodobacter halotolerans]